MNPDTAFQDIANTNTSINTMPPILRPRGDDGKLRDATDLGDTIRRRRKQLGYTQVKLAEICKCSPRFIGDLERGVAGGNIKQVIHVCKLLGIDLFARVRGE